MSEPNQGLPAPGGQPTGITPTPGQPPTPAPNPAPTQPTGTPPPAPATPPAPAGPDLATIQRERDQAVAHARQMQSQKDQAEARMRAMAGVVTQPDPMAARLAAYTEQGYSEKDARFFIGQIDAAVAPIRQENQQLQAQLQGSNVAQQAMQAAMNANPELFADPKIQEDVWASMQGTAQTGNIQVLTPEYAKFLGAQAWAIKNEPWKTQPQTPPPPAPLQGFRPAGLPPISFGGSPGHYPPPPAINTAPDPKVAELAAQMAAYTGIPLAPRT